MSTKLANELVSGDLITYGTVLETTASSNPNKTRVLIDGSTAPDGLNVSGWYGIPNSRTFTLRYV